MTPLNLRQILLDPGYSAGAAILAGLLLAAATSLSFLAISPGSFYAPELDVLEYNVRSCAVADAQSERVLRVYGLSRISAEGLASIWCSDPIIATRYGTVQVYWQRAEIERTEELVNRPYELLVAKPAVMERPEVRAIARYEPIASYEPYSSFLIARDSVPELTPEYLHGKRIGLRDSPQSFSGHVIPRRVLRDAGIPEDAVEVVYYRSHGDLRRALARGEVDLIGSYWADNDSMTLDSRYRLLLEEEVAPATWYVVPDMPRDIACALSAGLETQARAVTGYFRRLRALIACERGSVP